MVEIADIKDRDSLRAWLEETSQPREARVILAQRSGMRSVFLLTHRFQATNQTTLPIWRALLLSYVACWHTIEWLEAKKFPRLMASAIDAAEVARMHAFVDGSEQMSSSIGLATLKAFMSSTEAEIVIYNASAFVGEKCWAQLRLDLSILNSSIGGRDLFERSLWEKFPENLEAVWKNNRKILKKYSWDFWIDWYERALAGEPQPWPLLLEIALQEDDFWQGSDDEVMARINAIVERYEDPDLARMRTLISQQSATNLGSDEEVAARKRVLGQIEQLLRSLEYPGPIAGIGHNRPPDQLALDEEQISEVRTNAEVLREEASSTAPNLELVVEKASFFCKVIGWAAGKADLTVSEFCKKFGSALGVGAAAYFFGLIEYSYWASIVGVFQSIKDWIAIALGI